MRGVFSNFDRLKGSRLPRLPCRVGCCLGFMDSANWTWGIFLLQGLGMCLPWNLFIMAENYFHDRLVHTIYKDTFLVWFMMGFNVPMVLTMGLRATLWRNRFQDSIQQVTFCLCVITLIVFGQFILTNEPDFNGYPFFYITIGSIVVISSASTLGQDGLFRICSTFPPEFVQSVVIGQAISALAVALSNFMILWFRFTHHQLLENISSSSSTTTPSGYASAGLAAVAEVSTQSGSSDKLPTVPMESLRWKWITKTAIDVDFCASLYFFLGLVVSLGSLMAFAALQYQPVFLQFCQPPKVRLPTLDDEVFQQASERLLSPSSSDSTSTSGSTIMIDGNDSAATSSTNKRGFWTTVHAIRTYIWASLAIFVMTLTVFPDLVTSIRSMQSQESAFLKELFVPLSLVVFTTGDLLGRMMANLRLRLPWFSPTGGPRHRARDSHPGRTLLMASLLRFCFVPLLLFCNVRNAQYQVLTPWVLIRNDYMAWTLIALCAISNGLLAALVMMKYPNALHTSQAKEMGGTLMFFAIAIGLCVGAIGAFGLRYFVLSP